MPRLRASKLRTAASAESRFEEAVKAGFAEKDMSAVVEPLRASKLTSFPVCSTDFSAPSAFKIFLHISKQNLKTPEAQTTVIQVGSSR
jgi:hypothetical protein